LTQTITIAANFVAILILVFGIYFPRHHHRDLVVAFLGINAGVLAVSTVLSSVNASLGLGIGLLGVLSIIRLRSDELNQRQVAYYFASLALGLLGGTEVANYQVTLALMGALLLVLWLGDHPRLFNRYKSRILTVDRAFVDEQQIMAYLTPKLGVNILGISILRVDLVNDTTVVDVRFTTDALAPLVSGEVAVPATTSIAAW
jgi:hypothetical protein